jgi:hypothetical protein
VDNTVLNEYFLIYLSSPLLLALEIVSKASLAGRQWFTPIILAIWDRDGEDSSSMPVRAKSLQDPISTKEKLSVAEFACLPAMVGSVK